ncbi:MAG TPA: xanthine dehydrogenase family protein subunit M [Rhizobiaceae bacterium]|nr:xanthine dehydrogenase family protein subunit M [Rhizobiaceae bacterium]
MVRYARPETVDEALSLLGEDAWRILAGGTDFYPALGAKPLRGNVLDINRLDELRGISETGEQIVIGARTTWTDIVNATLAPAFTALKQAAREVGSVQIQNRATVAGNLCNASPAADGVPALLVLDAEVELRSHGGTRYLPLGEFILGNRKTARQPGELLTAIRIPKESTAGASTFLKLGARRYLVISIAMVAVRLDIDAAENVCDAAAAIGACSAVAQRLPELENTLMGARAGETLAALARPEHLSALSPIDDVRGSADYRRGAALEIVRRAIASSIAARVELEGLAA